MKVKIFSIIIMVLLLLALLPATVAMAAFAPLLPFNATGDLFVLEDGTCNVLSITPAGAVSIDVTKAEIDAAIVAAGGSAGSDNFQDKGIAFDAAGNMYFTVYANGPIMKKTKAGVLSVLALNSELVTDIGGTPEPDGVAFSDDGYLYVIEDSGGHVVQVNPDTGAATIWTNQSAFVALVTITTSNIEHGIVAADGGVLYVASHGDPDAIFEIDSFGTPSVLASAPPFSSLEDYMTRDPSGNLIVTDFGADMIYEVTTGGTVSTYLSKAVLDAVNSNDVTLDGGIAFDSSGDFYVAEEMADDILVWDGGTLSVWVTRATMDTATGGTTDLEGGIAFEPAFGTIRIQKDADPEYDWDFDFSGDLGIFTLNDDGIGTEWYTEADWLAGQTYVVVEAADSQWDLTDITIVESGTSDSTGVVGTRTATIILQADETVTVTFENEEELPPYVGGVGGEAYPINKVSVLAPWLGLMLILAIGGGIFTLRRRRAH